MRGVCGSLRYKRGGGCIQHVKYAVYRWVYTDGCAYRLRGVPVRCRCMGGGYICVVCEVCVGYVCVSEV